ncbi:MAG TPA: M42 family metallopeptidase [Anaerolineae bacterium]|nr:M42 family metallopeptidase [Anaerolineae bacterium]
MILEALSNAFGPSGCEGKVRQVVLDAIADKVDEVQVDHLGNVIARQKGTDYPAFKVMVAAHMDEVGFMITHADDNGLLHFTKVGGIDDRVLPAKVVRIGKSQIPGVISMKPVHLTGSAERGKVVSHEDMAIDIGVSSKAEAERLVTKGDYAVFDVAFEELGTMVKGKAFDDRAGCAVLIALIERGPYPFDFWPVFTTMEEVGLRGAQVAAYRVMPDVAFALEGTICDDGPREKDISPTTAVGKGPAISPMDRSVIADRRLVRLLIETAEAEGIPYQLKQPGMGGTDAGAIHLAKTGVPSVPVSVPSRYIHSPVCMLSKEDLENTVRLMAATLRRITPEGLRADRGGEV